MALKVKVDKVENSAERLICTGLIVSDNVMGQLATIIDVKHFTAKYTQTLATWCLDYYKQFGCAPKAHIQDIFESAKRDYLDEDVATLIETLLVSLNDEMMGESQFNEQYVLTRAEEYIKSRSLAILCEDVQALNSTNRVLEAEGMLAQYHIPKRPQSQGVEVFTDQFWSEEDTEADILFRFPGELDKLIGAVERDSFISLIGPEKRGKTWWLMWIALLAYRQRCNVAFFSAGDMTMKQMQRRFKHMLTGRDPKRPKSKVRMPVLDCLHNQYGECPLGKDTDSILQGGKGKLRELGSFDDFPDHVICSQCYRDKEEAENFIGRVWWKEEDVADMPIDKAYKQMLKRSGNKHFRLYTFPPSSLTVAQMNAQLDIEQQQSNFIPDVVVLDYADLLDVEPNARKLEYRHQINAGWMALRSMSQVRNCALFTATQAKLEARKKSQVDQWDTSEDKRKLAHITAMLALNQTPAEKRRGLMRISNLATRDSFFDTEQNVGVLQCLALGKPHILSFPYKPDPKRASKNNED